MDGAICGWGACGSLAAAEFDTPLCREHLIRAWVVVQDHLDLVLDQAATEPIRVTERRRLGGVRKVLPSSVVYYVRLLNGDIKIGYTGQLAARRAQLRVEWDSVLAVEPGGPARESERHAQFADTRRAGRREDFAPTPTLMKHIRDVRIRWGDPRHIAAQIRESALAG